MIMNLLKSGILGSRRSFKFSILTTVPNETFTLPLLAGTHNFSVNWGDGSAENIVIAFNDVNRVHTYTAAGTYIISMNGTCTKFVFNDGGDKLKIKQLLDFVDMGFTTLNFYGCSNLTSIASSMKKLESLTTAEKMFKNNTSLTSIPAGIFDGCMGITNFGGAFYGCSGLTTIPADLFSHHTLVTTFESTFKNCINAQLNINIFYVPGAEGTRFLNMSVNFDNCFYRTSFSGVQGTAPDLWNCDFGTGTPTKTNCYAGAGNSLTSLSNYGDIPGKLLTINVSPVTDWAKGDIITGQTSGKTCIIVAKVTNTTYQVNSGVYTGWTSGEVIGVTGNNNKLVDQKSGAPTFSALWM